MNQNKEYLLEQIESLKKLRAWLKRIAIICGILLIGFLGIAQPLMSLQHTKAEDISLIYVEAMLWILTGIMFVILFYIVSGCVKRVEKQKQEQILEFEMNNN